MTQKKQKCEIALKWRFLAYYIQNSLWLRFLHFDYYKEIMQKILYRTIKPNEPIVSSVQVWSTFWSLYIHTLKVLDYKLSKKCV